jgi:hypothetical protein
MSRPPLVQAALLHDGLHSVDLDAVVREFRAADAGASGTTWAVPEAMPGSFYRLFGSNDVMVTVERIERPAKASLFETAMSSPFTRIGCPDARDRILRHRSHVLVGVHHGAVPPDPTIQDMLQSLNMGRLMGDSLAQYKERLRLCGLMGYLVNQRSEASLVHWTASDHLLRGAVFDELAEAPAPSLLHVHPLLFDGGSGEDGTQRFEVKTFGVAHFIGREIHVPSSPLPLPEILNAVLAFVKLATMDKGYVVPDGDVFGPESGDVSFRVRHVEAGQTSGNFDGPLYRISLAYSRALGFMAPDYVPRETVFDDRTAPPEVLNAVGDAREAFLADIRGRREMAEAAGVRLEVKAPVGLSDGRMGIRTPPSLRPQVPFGKRRPN